MCVDSISFSLGRYRGRYMGRRRYHSVVVYTYLAASGVFPPPPYYLRMQLTQIYSPASPHQHSHEICMT